MPPGTEPQALSERETEAAVSRIFEPEADAPSEPADPAASPARAHAAALRTPDRGSASIPPAALLTPMRPPASPGGAEPRERPRMRTAVSVRPSGRVGSAALAGPRGKTAAAHVAAQRGAALQR